MEILTRQIVIYDSLDEVEGGRLIQGLPYPEDTFMMPDKTEVHIAATLNRG